MTQPVTTLETSREIRTCKVGDIINSLCAEDQATLNEALDGPEDLFPSGRIVTILATLGISITKDSIIKHRRGFCRCENL